MTRTKYITLSERLATVLAEGVITDITGTPEAENSLYPWSGKVYKFTPNESSKEVVESIIQQVNSVGQFVKTVYDFIKA